MGNHPAPTRQPDIELVRLMIREQAPTFAELPLTYLRDGWDCAIYRLGNTLTVRIPIRDSAVGRLEAEMGHLPAVAERLTSRTVVRVPHIEVVGVPGLYYPWPWMIVSWLDGDVGLDIPLEQRSGWVSPLVSALRELHAPAEGVYPENESRGVALQLRDTIIQEYLAVLRSGSFAAEAELCSDAWAAGLAAEPYAGPAVWIHGDVHLANLIDDGSCLGIIDWGDITAGDPAYDLAVAWNAFTSEDRARFRWEYGGDAALWVRARGWAAAAAATLLARSDDWLIYQDAALQTIRALATD